MLLRLVDGVLRASVLASCQSVAHTLQALAVGDGRRPPRGVQVGRPDAVVVGALAVVGQEAAVVAGALQQGQGAVALVCHPLAQGAEVLGAGAGAATHGVAAILLRGVQVVKLLLRLDKHGGGGRLGDVGGGGLQQETVPRGGDAQPVGSHGGGGGQRKVALGPEAIRGGLLLGQAGGNAGDGDGGVAVRRGSGGVRAVGVAVQVV